ncbi:MAG TPA: phosphatase PAP2 family protein [Gaiellales bacterium]|jgi:undecaprenyl-diphosphatase|nr:phosphatase PAP2 family protein [Gaiellales bacterium]
MKALSAAGAHGLVWIAIAAVLAVRFRRPLVLVATIAAELVAGQVDAVLKDAIGRDRPPVADPAVHALIPVPSDPSMPSGHAVMAFAGAVLLGVVASRLRWPLGALAVAIAVSRVYLGVHYPSDVIVGAAVGAVIGAASAVVLRVGERRLAGRRVIRAE